MVRVIYYNQHVNYGVEIQVPGVEPSDTFKSITDALYPLQGKIRWDEEDDNLYPDLTGIYVGDVVDVNGTKLFLASTHGGPSHWVVMPETHFEAWANADCETRSSVFNNMYRNNRREHSYRS